MLSLENIADLLLPFSGAMLGAAFYILVKTQPYLISRTYDPKYNAVYIGRFITGTIAGIILAIGLRPWIEKALPSDKGFVFAPGLLGILGGYAAEVVEQLLQRLADTLLSLLRGDNSAKAQADAKAEQNDANANVRGKLVELERAQSDPEKFREILDTIHATLKPDAKK